MQSDVDNHNQSPFLTAFLPSLKLGLITYHFSRFEGNVVKPPHPPKFATDWIGRVFYIDKLLDVSILQWAGIFSGWLYLVDEVMNQK